ncbi:predicted protein [Sclerotinia sclerotiorum 1980 UF-70]|uniref:Uncharacterized protein n=2 Tax=Sclerotinia sclerotiorum (strain ATCC 18683 / 1980 / Ss-1) TaxID=665079 RepID=A7ENG9_SCLS1|nr:predicted protein [Sclerotinia sclerotiorum 1980 UF-70]APA14828.1 hypothetical protein sscle_13g095980 [Sclerotinia sclerotiorum 1980 UF-70]EDO04385.1 predicted protein [Sclerotinia sclerotiorum 1980 UF-70]
MSLDSLLLLRSLIGVFRSNFVLPALPFAAKGFPTTDFSISVPYNFLLALLA